jgi:hypothetical protein
MRTHLFDDCHGRRCRIVDSGEGLLSDPYLEIDGIADSPCYITGPEILKLSKQGRVLWNALRDALEAWEGDHDPNCRRENMIACRLMESARLTLDRTAATFDHNEPEEQGAEARPRGGWEEPEPARHDPTRPIPLVPEVAAFQRGECVTEQEHLAGLDEGDVYPEVDRAD